jgi:hypothetical protein
MVDWQTQLQNPATRQYVPIPKHSGGPTEGRHGTVMDLAFAEALEVLQGAVYDPAAATGTKAPSLWGHRHGKVYRFMWDGLGGWHGYPADEKPPNAVLQHWREDGTISEPEYGKIRRYPNRGS